MTLKKAASKDELFTLASNLWNLKPDQLNIRVADKLDDSFNKTASINKQAAGSTDFVSTQFYSPRLTPDTWYLPRNRKMLYKWVEIFYDWDPYISSILNMHSRYPLTEFSLVTDDPKQKEFFDHVLNNESWNILDVMREGSLSLKKYGEALCLTGDTKVELLDGTSKTIKELHDSKVEDFWVYSVDTDGSIVPGKANKVICTKKNAKVLKVTLDTGEYFKCTPEHLVLMRDGTYKEAQDLTPNSKVKASKDCLVISVDSVANEDVYDIECVDKYHNFALSCGVFVHNCFGDWNSELGIWDNFVWLDPSLIEVEEVPFTSRLRIYTEIPSKYVKLLKSNKPGDIDKQKYIPESIKQAVKQGKKYIELDTEERITEDGKYSPPKVCMLINRSDIGENGVRGMPPITPLLKDLVYGDHLRKAQVARAQRFAYPVEIWKLGDVSQNILPDEAALDSVREMLKQALAAPPYTVVYSPLLSYEVVSPAGGLLPIYDDYNFIENRILVGLGVNKNIVLGEGGWMGAAKTLSMQRLVMDYQVDRDMWSKRFLQNFVLRPMCIHHKYTKADPIFKKDKPIVPKISWAHSLDIQSEEDQKKLYMELWDKGALSTKTLYTKFPDLDFNVEMRNLEQERGTILDGTGRKLPAFVNQLNQTSGEFEKPDQIKQVLKDPANETSTKDSSPAVPAAPPKPQQMDI